MQRRRPRRGVARRGRQRPGPDRDQQLRRPGRGLHPPVRDPASSIRSHPGGDPRASASTSPRATTATSRPTPTTSTTPAIPARCRRPTSRPARRGSRRWAEPAWLSAQNGRTLAEEGWATGLTTYDPTTKTWDTPGAGRLPVRRRRRTEPDLRRAVVPEERGADPHCPGLGGQAARVVPDVAMVGDPKTGMLVGQTQTFADGRVLRRVPHRGHQPVEPAVRRRDGAGRPARGLGRPASPTRPCTGAPDRALTTTSTAGPLGRGPEQLCQRRGRHRRHHRPSGRTIDAEVQSCEPTPATTPSPAWAPPTGSPSWPRSRGGSRAGLGRRAGRTL